MLKKAIRMERKIYETRSIYAEKAEYQYLPKVLKNRLVLSCQKLPHQGLDPASQGVKAAALGYAAVLADQGLSILRGICDGAKSSLCGVSLQANNVWSSKQQNRPGLHVIMQAILHRRYRPSRESTKECNV